MGVRGWLWVVLLGGAIVNVTSPANSAPIPQLLSPRNQTIKLAKTAQQPHFIRPKVTCPADVESLTKAMLRDLPGYMNRLYLRILQRQKGEMSYAIATSQPDFVPLPIGSSEYPSLPDKNLHQIFFTMLERQYLGKQVAQLQTYHWLFLSKTQDGWQIALMFSRFGFYPTNNQQITPPQDSSQSLAAQAIRLWLRDCQAGSVRL